MRAKKLAALKRADENLEAEVSEQLSAARAFFGQATFEKMKAFRDAHVAEGCWLLAKNGLRWGVAGEE